MSAAAAGACATLLVWLGPPGADLAEHAYQRTLFLHHGFALWNNFWYAGRYSFVTYSVLYYPLAGLLGIRLLAVATVSTAALAFAVVIGREWGPAVRWSSRTFAVVWAGIVLSAAFPFALGAALALLAIWALQARKNGRFALLAALTIAASPLAFLLLALLLAGFGLARWRDHSALLVPGLILVGFGAVEALLWRIFPGGGLYPFSPQELAAAITFCVLGAGLTWRVEGARALRWVFVVYFVACTASFLIPSAVGENVARLRYAAVPVCVLLLSLRRWRPLPVCLGALALAVSWNATPIAGQYLKGRADPASKPAYWTPAIEYLRAHLTPSYRVEAVDTAGHWGATYLAEDLPELAPEPRRPLRRPHGGAAGLQRGRRGGAAPQWPLRPAARVSGDEPGDLRGAAGAPDPDRARARAGSEDDRLTPPRRSFAPRPLPARGPLLAVLERRERVPRASVRRNDDDRGPPPRRAAAHVPRERRERSRGRGRRRQTRLRHELTGPN